MFGVVISPGWLPDESVPDVDGWMIDVGRSVVGSVTSILTTY